MLRRDGAHLEHLLEPGNIAEKEPDAKGKQRRRYDIHVFEEGVLDNAQPAAARRQQITVECNLNI